MKTALLALFFLLFAFYTEQVTPVEVVLDFYGDEVESGKPYYIREATNYSQAISLDQVGNQTCAISVVLAIDPKQVIFHTQVPAENIKTGELLSIEFSWVPACTESNKWELPAEVSLVYPIWVGNPSNPFTFQIKRAQDPSNGYNLFFTLFHIAEHALATQPYRVGEELLVLKPFSAEALNVMFFPHEDFYSKSVCKSIN